MVLQLVQFDIVFLNFSCGKNKKGPLCFILSSYYGSEERKSNNVYY